MKIRSFRQKILLALVATVASLTMLTLAVMSFYIRSEILRKTRADLVKAREVFAQQQRQRLAMLQELGSRLTQSRRLSAAVEEADPEVVAGVVQNEQEISRLGRPTFVAVADRSGRVLVHGWDGKLTIPAEETSIARNEAGHYRIVAGQILEGFAMPLQTGEDNVGNILLAFPVTDRTAAELAAASLHEVEAGFLLDGRVVASTLPAAEREELERQVTAREQQQLRLGNVPYTAFVMPLVAGGRAAQVVLISQQSLQRLLTSLRNGALICGVIALLICVWISTRVSHGISAPVAELEHATRQIRAGNFTVRAAPRTDDELGRLADAFNEMAAGLELKEKYRGVLDKVVSPQVGEELLRGKIELGGELRSVTVLFSDIRGFTAMTEGMQPRHVLELLNRHMTAMTEIIRRHGGIVDKFVGDEIMAVFGAPQPHPNHARAALSAALEMRQAQRKSADGFAIGLGVNTGEALAGNMGSDKQMSYTVLGATVNLAARLCKSAQPMQILVSDAVIAGAGPGVRARSLEPMSVKGFTKPVEVFELEEVRP
jgi:class 3 adenylate cyclase